MIVRLSRALTLLAVVASLLPVMGLAQQGSRLRDQHYTSPNWGFSVRWHGDEWRIDDQASADGTDSLWLRNDDGVIAGFVAGALYGGDAPACLDDQIAMIEAMAGVDDLPLIQDELGAEQTYRRPARAWSLMVLPQDDGDLVIYLDCRTLIPSQASFIRTLVSPAATFEADFDTFSVLNATLPRSAWAPNADGGLAAPDLNRDGPLSPLPTDLFMPWDYPRDPWLLFDNAGNERGTMTMVDGTPDSRQFLIAVENNGEEPLAIDPARFSAANDPAWPEVDAEIIPLQARWEAPGAPGRRVLAPGTQASIVLGFPDFAQMTSTIIHLVYRDEDLPDGVVRLDCLKNCGYGGGGSRIPLIISRQPIDGE
jgi:hypothetical protein